MNHKRVAVAAIALSLVVAACGSDAKTSSNTSADSGKSILNGEIKCNQQYKGKEVHIFSPTRDTDTDHPIAEDT